LKNLEELRPLSLNSFFKIVVQGGDTFWHLQKFSQYIKYKNHILLEFNHTTILLYHPASISLPENEELAEIIQEVAFGSMLFPVCIFCCD
jgi:hypothetical protein